MICDNISNCHNLITVSDKDVLRVLCNNCNTQFIIRKDPFKGNPEIKQYAEIFKKDILQPKDNLFYKYYSQYLKL